MSLGEGGGRKGFELAHARHQRERRRLEPRHPGRMQGDSRRVAPRTSTPSRTPPPPAWRCCRSSAPGTSTPSRAAIRIRSSLGDRLADRRTSRRAASCSSAARSTRGFYSHAIATMALCEAYGLSKDPRLKAAGAARDRLHRRGPEQVRRRLAILPGAEGDTSVFGWQMFALRSARLAGLDVPKNVHQGVRPLPRPARLRQVPGPDLQLHARPGCPPP